MPPKLSTLIFYRTRSSDISSYNEMISIAFPKVDNAQRQSLVVKEVSLVEQVFRGHRWESLAAEVKADDGVIHHVRFERVLRDTKDDSLPWIFSFPRTADKEQEPPPKFLTHQGTFITFLESPPPEPCYLPFDRARSRNGSTLANPSDTIIAKLTCKEDSKLHFHQLALIAEMVHDSELSYLYRKNCYWYTRAIMSILEKVTGCEMETFPPKETLFSKLLLFFKLTQQAERPELPFERPSEQQLQESLAHFFTYQSRFWESVNESDMPHMVIAAYAQVEFIKEMGLGSREQDVLDVAIANRDEQLRKLAELIARMEHCRHGWQKQLTYDPNCLNY